MPDTGEASFLVSMIGNASSVYVKKLSRNDRDWARLTNKHQAGVYIPAAERDCGFFPALSVKPREKGEEIREVFFETEWPQYSIKRLSRLVNYTSKGVETHLTGIPKEAFSALSPASYLVISKFENNSPYQCITIDSESDEALLLATLLDIDSDVVSRVTSPRKVRDDQQNQILILVEMMLAAWEAGKIADLVIAETQIPSTATLARMARTRYLELNGLPDLNPMRLERPGDAIREISRNVEWELFRNLQRRSFAVALVRMVIGDEPASFNPRNIIRRVVENVSEIDALMLSGAQQRKSRAGYSFEHHIEALLLDGHIPFAKQVIMDAKKRPDFVLPSEKWLRSPPVGSPQGLILSAKTTLRERWKQVQREMGDYDLFLATVDESIAGNAISDMRDMGIILIVPESLKVSPITEYGGHDNVLDFRTFFRSEIAVDRLPGWLS